MNVPGGGGAGDVGVPADDGLQAQLDMTTSGIRKSIRQDAADPETKELAPTTTATAQLAKAIATNDDHGEAAIAQAQADLKTKFDRLMEKAKSGELNDEQVMAQHKALAEHERVVEAATHMLRRVSQDRTPAEHREAIPMRAPTPDTVTWPAPDLLQNAVAKLGPQPQAPEALSLSQRLAAHEAMDKANAHAAPTAQDIALGRAKSAAETTMRGKSLGRIIADKNEPNLRAAFQKHLEAVGFHPEITPPEHALLLTEEDHRQREAMNVARAQAAEAAAAQPEQDTHLGVLSREEVAAQREARAAREAPPAPEPVAAPEPTPTPEDVTNANIKTRGETHIQNRELGPVKAKWFREGMKQALGEDHQTPTTVKMTADNFKDGQAFVAEERAHQDREHAIEQERLRQERESSTPPERPAPLPKRQQALRASKERQPQRSLRQQAIEARLGERGEPTPAAKEAITASKAKAEPKPEPKPAPKPEPVAKKEAPPAAKKAVAASKAKAEPKIVKEPPKPVVKKPVEEKPVAKAVTPEQAKARKIVEERKAVEETRQAEVEKTVAEADDRKTLVKDIDTAVPDNGKGGELTKWQAQHLNKLEAETIKIGGEEVPKYPPLRQQHGVRDGAGALRRERPRPGGGPRRDVRRSAEPGAGGGQTGRGFPVGPARGQARRGGVLRSQADVEGRTGRPRTARSKPPPTCAPNWTRWACTTSPRASCRASNWPCGSALTRARHLHA